MAGYEGESDISVLRLALCVKRFPPTYGSGERKALTCGVAGMTHDSKQKGTVSMKYRKVMKIGEASVVTGISKMQLYRLVREGKVIAYKQGTNSSPWLFPKGELFKWYMKRSFKTWREKLQSSLIKAHKDEQGHTPKHNIKLCTSPDETEG